MIIISPTKQVNYKTLEKIKKIVKDGIQKTNIGTVNITIVGFP